MPSRQAGYAGLIILLLALVVVALLTKTMLGQMGLLGTRPESSVAVKRPARTAPVEDAASAASVTPGSALERARGLEAAVQEQARQNAEAIDKAAQ